MRGVRRYLCRLFAATVIEIDDQLRVAGKAFGSGDVLDPVLRPKPVFGAEGINAAFRRNARAGQNDDLAHVSPFVLRAK